MLDTMTVTEFNERYAAEIIATRGDMEEDEQAEGISVEDPNFATKVFGTSVPWQS